jgi:predicted glycosyltransferase
MRILFSVSHPAHAHLFKNTIWKLQALNHDILICARKKEVTIDLLKKYGFTYTVISETKPSRVHLLAEQMQRIMRFRCIVSEFKPDLSISTMDPSLAFVSRLMGVPYVCLADTEHASASINGALPFTKAVLTPSCFSKEMGPKQIRYNGYHELAYLHPNRFTPNPAVLTELGLAEGDPFIIVRFVSWQASHDVGQHGIRDKVGLVKALEQYGRVLITSEGALPEELQPYQIRVSPEKLHDLLYYATLYVGDGGTTASEAAVLGTPAIFISTLYCGYQLDEEKYGLLYLFSDPVSGVKNGLRKAVALLNDPNLKENAYLNRLKLLEDKIDVTEFMVWFVENYPESCHQIKADPEKQYPLATS